MKNLANELRVRQCVYVRVKVHPSASKDELKEVLIDGTYKINIAAAPEKNRANRRLIDFIAKNLDINAKNVIIINGKTSKIKLIKITYDEQQ